MVFRHEAKTEGRPWRSLKAHGETLSTWLRDRKGIVVYKKKGIPATFVPFNYLDETAKDTSDFSTAPKTVIVDGKELLAVDYIQVEDYLRVGDPEDSAISAKGRGMLMKRAMKSAFDPQG